MSGKQPSKQISASDAGLKNRDCSNLLFEVGTNSVLRGRAQTVPVVSVKARSETRLRHGNTLSAMKYYLCRMKLLTHRISEGWVSETHSKI